MAWTHSAARELPAQYCTPMPDQNLARDRGKTIVLTSHLMSALEELADTIVLLVDGRVQFVESVETLRVRTGQPNLERAVARLLTGADHPHAGPLAAGAAGPVSGNGSTPG